MPKSESFELSKTAFAAVTTHALETYPEECCGVILGGDEVHRLVNLQNTLHATDPDTFPRDARTAYTVDPKELETVLEQAERRGLAFKALYHSHPDHDAYFSDEDRACATPFGTAHLSGHGPDRDIGHERQGRPGGGLRLESRRRGFRGDHNDASPGTLTPRHHSLDVRGLGIHWVEWGKRGLAPIILNPRLPRSLPDLGLLRGRVAANPCRTCGWWRRTAAATATAAGSAPVATIISSTICWISTNSSGIWVYRRSGWWATPWAGTIACLYAGTHPERVSKLALVEGLGPEGLSFSDAPQRAARWLKQVPAVGEGAGYASLEEAADRLRRSHPRLTEERARHLAYHGMRRTETGLWQWKFDPLHRTTSPQPFYVEQFLEFLRRVTCPSLVVQGAESNHRARGDIETRYGLLPDATLVTLPEAGHMVQQDNPLALARTLAPFLA